MLEDMLFFGFLARIHTVFIPSQWKDINKRQKCHLFSNPDVWCSDMLTVEVEIDALQAPFSTGQIFASFILQWVNEWGKFKYKTTEPMMRYSSGPLLYFTIVYYILQRYIHIHLHIYTHTSLTRPLGASEAYTPGCWSSPSPRCQHTAQWRRATEAPDGRLPHLDCYWF